MSWLAMSRPRLSVPIQWLALGGARRKVMSMSVGEWGVHTSDSAAQPSSRLTRVAPRRRLGLLRIVLLTPMMA